MPYPRTINDRAKMRTERRVGGGRFPGYIAPAYPLLDLDMSRDDCEQWLRARGWTSVAKSACIGCPFHGNRQWRDLRDNHPDEWADAVAFDAAFRTAPGLDAQRFLHEARAPLDRAPIDRTTRAEWRDRQGDLFDQPADAEIGAGVGGHGVPTNPAPALPGYDATAIDAMEYGDPDGCSPYGCRSGVSVDLGSAA